MPSSTTPSAAPSALAALAGNAAIGGTLFYTLRSFLGPIRGPVATAALYGTISLGFGVNAILNPAGAL
ncbi:hypothetical protein HK405_013549, partial [Cladochytrium tenue]